MTGLLRATVGALKGVSWCAFHWDHGHQVGGQEHGDTLLIDVKVVLVRHVQIEGSTSVEEEKTKLYREGIIRIFES